MTVGLLVKARDVVGLPVVTLGGEDVAEVRDVVYDPEAGRLVGLTLNKRGFLRGRMKEVLAADSIHAIGRDAVMIVDDACLVAGADAPPEVARPDRARNVIGNEVLTETGTRVGTVSDLILIMGGTGEVVGYELEVDGDHPDAFIPLPAQLAVSGSALVVPERTTQFVRRDLAGFGAAVDEYRRLLPSDGGDPASPPTGTPTGTEVGG